MSFNRPSTKNSLSFFKGGLWFGVSLLLWAVSGAQAEDSIDLRKLEIEVDLYVSQEAGASDENPGSLKQPIRSLAVAAQRAFELTQGGYAVRVWIGPGFYRESIVLEQREGVDNGPLVFQALESGRTVLSGSDVVSGWRIGDSDTFEHSWGFGEQSATSRFTGALAHSELAFVESVRLRQVDAGKLLVPGRFRVDRKNERIHLLPPPNGTIADGLVEVSNPNRQVLFRAKRVKNLVLRGLFFQHASTEAESEEGAVFLEDCQNVLIEDSFARYNNWTGFAIRGGGSVELSNVTSELNAWTGIQAEGTAGLTFGFVTAKLNGWRLLENGFADRAGFAAVHCEDITELSISNLTCTENRTSGLLIRDVGAGAVLRKVFSAQNQGAGVKVEGGSGINVAYCRLVQNYDQGIVLKGDAELEGNVIYDNGVTQLFSEGVLRLTARRNILGSALQDETGEGAILALSEQSDWEASKNMYFSLTPEASFAVGAERLDWTAWQKAKEPESESLFADPLFSNPTRFQYVPRPESPWFKLQ